MKDYYQILGVKKDASKEEIKKAFHKLAHQHHPDKKGGDEAKFKEINEAYQILSDDQKRSQYDHFGAYTGNTAGGFGGGQWGDFDFSNFSGAAGGQGFEFDLGDIFGDFFGGGQGSRIRRGRDISVDVQISFAESVFGVERQILLTKVGVCDTCQGSGAEPGSKMVTCTTCNGKGKINETKRSIFGAFATTRVCETCHGRGQIPEKKCHTCGGAGVLKKSEEIKVAIPAGIENGEMIRMTGQGEATPGGVSGDLYIKIHVEKDPKFQRSGQNIEMDLAVKLTDALLGTETKIDTLDGDITISIPAGISSGEILRVRNKGVPIKNDKRGDLLIRVIIKTPNKLSRKAKQLIDDLRQEGL